MSTNTYIRFEEPAIPGTSTAPGHEQEIEILSWDHGINQTASGRGSAEQPTQSNLSVSKYLDTASREIMKKCWSGQQFGKVTLTCYRSDGATDNSPVVYLKVVMEHVVVSTYSVSGGPGDLPVENLSLDYGTVQYNYVPGDTAAPTSLKLNNSTGEIE